MLRNNLAQRLFTGLGLFAFYAMVVMYGIVPYALMFIIIGMLGLLAEWPSLTVSWRPVSRWVLGLLYFLIPFLVWTYSYILYRSQGFWAVAYPVVVTTACDSGAYLIGRFFGAHYAFPRVSPKKTYEGVLAGYASVFVVHMLYSFYFLELSGYLIFIKRYPILMTFLIATASIVGDLTISLLKRSAGIKDSGVFFPGHGGIFDRVGSLLFVLTVIGILMLFC